MFAIYQLEVGPQPGDISGGDDFCCTKQLNMFLKISGVNCPIALPGLGPDVRLPFREYQSNICSKQYISKQYLEI